MLKIEYKMLQSQKPTSFPWRLNSSRHRQSLDIHLKYYTFEPNTIWYHHWNSLFWSYLVLLIALSFRTQLHDPLSIGILIFLLSNLLATSFYGRNSLLTDLWIWRNPISFEVLSGWQESTISSNVNLRNSIEDVLYLDLSSLISKLLLSKTCFIRMLHKNVKVM